ncbi:unnamed protein product [Cylicostephanus goldi]|uniref:Uncharacterized protein n=1 Tax=Cylicostephanus goldi TaxID=71465 RepID=A0A3P7MXR2_CYLGO|nr:unnamed protein product [Cylicostephanus goldi]
MSDELDAGNDTEPITRSYLFEIHSPCHTYPFAKNYAVICSPSTELSLCVKGHNELLPLVSPVARLDETVTDQLVIKHSFYVFQALLMLPVSAEASYPVVPPEEDELRYSPTWESDDEYTDFAYSDLYANGYFTYYNNGVLRSETINEHEELPAMVCDLETGK